MKKIISLNGDWLCTCIDPSGEKSFNFTGNVPGCVHTDLMGSVIDSDIYYRDNSKNCQWIENMDWVYTKTFSVSEISGGEVLVFEGLDVYADVYLNDILLGNCDDMFITYSFDISDKLVLGENTVKVYFHSPINAVLGLPALPGAFTTERLNTRRIQCTYGWDWCERLVTCGICGNVYIKTNNEFSVENIYVYTEHIGETSSQIAFEATFENFENGKLVNVEILSPDGFSVYSHDFFVKERLLKGFVDIKNAKLWYPTGYGDQPLYTIIIGEKKTSFGIRSVRILEEPDEVGSAYYNKCLEIKNNPSAEEYDHNDSFSGFALLVNNVKVMCKGANWVPCEPFPSEESDEKITRLLELARLGGLNMIRVWGGGVFEKDHFYNECDRLGIMLTQDFLMACGKYPEENPHFIDLVKTEAKEAALRLRNHPSLMWWSGDNENAVLGSDETDNYKGRTVTHESILPMLNKYDPRRRFLLSSPYGGNFFSSKTVGTTHNTQYMTHLLHYFDTSDMKDYKEVFGEYTARFIAEEPAFGAATEPTLKRFMTHEDIYNSSDIWLHHTKGNPDLSKEILDYAFLLAEKILGNFKDGADRFFKLKYLHYEWVRVSFETARRNKGFCNGIIYWMFNDCWPSAVSWALVDYYCLPKPAFYSFKRCSKSVVASVIKNTDGCDVYVSNDSLSGEKLNLRVYLISDNKTTLLASDEVYAEPNASVLAKHIVLPPLLETDVVICDVGNETVSDRASYKQNNLAIHKTETVKVLNKTQTHITVSADTYVHAVELEGEYLFEDNYFSLLPGETKTISIKSLGETSELSVIGYTI